MHGFPGALLSHLVTFMYSGEATVEAEIIEQFLDMGKELKIEGLYDREEHSENLEEVAKKESSDSRVLKTNDSAGKKKGKEEETKDEKTRGKVQPSKPRSRDSF